MLTHLHLLIHTWWCWHTLRRRWSLKGRERSCEARFDAFKKMKCIFSIVLVENLEKLSECFPLKKHSPDTLTTGTGRWACMSGVLSVSGKFSCVHRTPSTGRGLDPVFASSVALHQQYICNALWVRVRCWPGAFDGCVRWSRLFWQTSLRTWPVCTRPLTASTGLNFTVRDQRVRFY